MNQIPWHQVWFKQKVILPFQIIIPIHKIEMLNALLAVCEGNPLVTSGFHSQTAGDDGMRNSNSKESLELFDALVSLDYF